MNDEKKKSIELLVDTGIECFAVGLTKRYDTEVDDEYGVINMKRKNCFIAELGDEFMFYSAFVRSFDSSFGNALEALGNKIAKLSYDVKGNINSFILPDQTQRIASVLDNYVDHTSEPDISHYSDFSVIYPKNTLSYERTHVTYNYFYNHEKNEHYLIELKASGDLDNKKARAEKSALLEEYFLLKNSLKDDKTAKIKIFFGTAYNFTYWGQKQLLTFFAEDELLSEKDYWNFVCNDSDGFDIVSKQIEKSRKNIISYYCQNLSVA